MFAVSDVRRDVPVGQRASLPEELPEIFNETLREWVAATWKPLQVANAVTPDMLPSCLAGGYEHGVVDKQEALS